VPGDLAAECGRPGAAGPVRGYADEAARADATIRARLTAIVG
jgi:hypothetical protein